MAFEGNKVAVYSIPWKTIRTLTVTYFQPYEPKCISAQGENAKFFPQGYKFFLITILLLKRPVVTSTSTSASTSTSTSTSTALFISDALLNINRKGAKRHHFLNVKPQTSNRKPNLKPQNEPSSTFGDKQG